TNPDAWKGILLMLGSGFCFALSNILIQVFQLELTQKGGALHPMNQLTGSLLFALPGLMISWAVIDGKAVQFSDTSLWATLYLAVIGSVIGFVAYFYLLSKISALSVSLIPLLTPAFALMAGNFLNGEHLTPLMLLGTCIIIISLGFFNEKINRAVTQRTKNGASKLLNKRAIKTTLRL
ncbi:MAG: DMT family transporter, partial [Sinobacterium sp.]|nr:DMT family transporter [Sinobacterium sp.]